MESTLQNRSSAARGIFSFLGALCLALVVMIFAWGTGYKLSLYNLEAATTSAPAKVCTRGSDAARDAVDHAADGSSTIQTPPLAAVFISLSQETEPVSHLRPPTDAARDLSPLRRAPVLNLRPPPQTFRSLD